MKVTVAIDSFKGSLTTFQAGNAARDGILRVYPHAEITVCPVADGGEGTVEAVVGALKGEYVDVTVTGPLGNPIKSSYGYIPSKKTAVIEMAKASGLTLVDENSRDPLYTTTYGVGELIKDAIEKGCRNFVIGIGGSATNDGGVGMLQALGFEFFDVEGKKIPFGAIGLKSLVKISTDNAIPVLRDCNFCIACDVTNPLCGENGCSAVFGPQKGATADSVRLMDGWLERYAELTKDVISDADAALPGTGAAGGLGFAFLAYLKGELKSGIGIVLEVTGAEEYIKTSDIVVTGEGRLDGQSYMGKAPVGIAGLAKKYGKPVLAFSGCVTPDAAVCNKYGIDAFFPVLRTPCTLAEAMDCRNAENNLSDTVEQVFRTVKAFQAPLDSALI